MNTEEKINLLLETIDAVDAVTESATNDNPNINEFEIEAKESWATSDYKRELFGILGKIVHEKYHETDSMVI